mgnify:CR=1 FL=1
MKNEIIKLLIGLLSKGSWGALKRALETVKFEEMRNKTFEVVRVVEKLCELCGKPLYTEERRVKAIQISSYKDYDNLMIRARAHDSVNVDLERNEIYLFDHDYPGDIHPACIEEYSKR